MVSDLLLNVIYLLFDGKSLEKVLYFEALLACVSKRDVCVSGAVRGFITKLWNILYIFM